MPCNGGGQFGVGTDMVGMRSSTTNRVDHLVDPAVMVRAALVDDLDAGFAVLMRTYATVVYSVALRTTGGPADAEDLSSETFLRAYRALRGYDHVRLAVLVPRPWLLSIVINTRRNQVRDAARRPRAAGDELPERPAAGPSVEDQAQNSALADELGPLLEQLPDAQRAAVVLRHVVDLPVGEVATILGCPTGTAKSHISRGLHRLRELIDEPDPDRPALASTGSQQ